MGWKVSCEITFPTCLVPHRVLPGWLYDVEIVSLWVRSDHNVCSFWVSERNPLSTLAAVSCSISCDRRFLSSPPMMDEGLNEQKSMRHSHTTAPWRHLGKMMFLLAHYKLTNTEWVKEWVVVISVVNMKLQQRTSNCGVTPSTPHLGEIKLGAEREEGQFHFIFATLGKTHWSQIAPHSSYFGTALSDTQDQYQLDIERNNRSGPIPKPKFSTKLFATCFKQGTPSPRQRQPAAGCTVGEEKVSNRK